MASVGTARIDRQVARVAYRDVVGQAELGIDLVVMDAGPVDQRVVE